jgi:hypothetical protein
VLQATGSIRRESSGEPLRVQRSLQPIPLDLRANRQTIGVPGRLICIGKTRVIVNSVAFKPRGSSVMEFGNLIETQMPVSDLCRSFTAYYAWELVS